MIKKLLFLVLLFAGPVFAQGVGIGNAASTLISNTGRPIAGASVAICQPLAVTSATANGSLATFTMASNPQTAGFVNGMQILVSGYAGNSAVFNAGRLVGNQIVGGFFILATSPSTITVALNQTATGPAGGTILGEGNTTSSCAGLATVYTDPTDTVRTPNPFPTDAFGNWQVFGPAGTYYVQFYGPQVTTTLRVLTGTGSGGGGGGGGGGNIGGTLANTQVAFGTAANTIGGSNNFTYGSGQLLVQDTSSVLTPLGTSTVAGDGIGTSYNGSSSLFEHIPLINSEFAQTFAMPTGTGNSGTTRKTFLGTILVDNTDPGGEAASFQYFRNGVQQSGMNFGGIGLGGGYPAGTDQFMNFNNDGTIEYGTENADTSVTEMFITPNAGIQMYTDTGATFELVNSPLKLDGLGGSFAEIGVASAAGSPNRLNLPTTTGTSGQVLTTNGANPQQLSWTTIAGGGNVSVSGSPTQYQIAAWASGTTIEGIGPGTVGYPLISNGAAAYPTFQQVTSAGVSLTTTNCGASNLVPLSSNSNGTLNCGGVSVAMLQSPSTSVNNQTCMLGGNCTIPFQTNGTQNTAVSGLNFETSTANSVGLTITPSNPGTTAEKFEITGGAYTGTAANLSGTPTLPNGTAAVTQSPGDNSTKLATTAYVAANGGGLSGLTVDGVLYGATSSSVASPTVPAVNGQYNCGYLVVASAAVAPTCPQVGLAARGVGGTTSTDTILYSDNDNVVEYQGSVAVATALPTPTTLVNMNFFTQLSNVTTGANTAVTVTPTTWTINGASTLVIAKGQTCTLRVDAVTATNWLSSCNINPANPGAIGGTTPAAGTFTTVTTTGATAGGDVCTQGSANGHATANTVTIECPAAVTSYEELVPGAAATGFLFWTNAANVVTDSLVGTSGSGNVCLVTSCVMITPSMSAIACGVLNTTACIITGYGSTSGTATITWPAVAGTITNPISISNSLQLPSGTVYNWNGDTGLSRASSTQVNVGNGTAGDSSGKIQAFSGQFTNILSTSSFAVLYSSTAPSISSGFGSSPSIAHNNGTGGFTVNVGTGGSASSGVITMPTTTTGWACSATPNGAPQAAAVTYSAPTSASSITLTNYTLATGVALAWSSGFVLQLVCSGY